MKILHVIYQPNMKQTGKLHLHLKKLICIFIEIIGHIPAYKHIKLNHFILCLQKLNLSECVRFEKYMLIQDSWFDDSIWHIGNMYCWTEKELWFNSFVCECEVTPIVLPVSPALPPQSLAVWNLPLDQHKNESRKLFRNLSVCFSPPSGFPARVTRKHYTDWHITAVVNMGTDLAYNFVFKGKFESVDWRSYSSYDTFYLRQFLWSE